ncbi:GtrA family protein [Candidatus Skiveiella danica]|jgi:putative flippase GtrA|uniref:GtrA family protein n=1 Tax=Candidatus Skiveiella danica TaxID=3386177 RepID=UPI0039B86340
MSLRKQFLVFGAVGTVGFIIDSAVLYATAGWLGWYGARALSFVAATTANWQLNRHFTFRSAIAAKRAGFKHLTRQYFSYLASMGGGALLNYAVYAAIIDRSTHPLAPLTGVAAGSIAGLMVNFFSARYLLLRRGQIQSPPQ